MTLDIVAVAYPEGTGTKSDYRSARTVTFDAIKQDVSDVVSEYLEETIVEAIEAAHKDGFEPDDPLFYVHVQFVKST